ncbi:hypothetical protein [Prevotella jejuni]|jgi:hypothetical protein|uniref:hypothetical protein n=1 Tax=Prevotella jejuni TaxID=1177574 RepID=UPI001BA824EC|nr:hypothetical protein [Prevotella jejuni]MBW4771654.1 hypothetical protein [Prevotella jejuni]QUB78990.1 hypothetical protein J4857_12200 [Prevotella jejuni]QUB82461.1 hypothetical protein J5A63_09645 [Prevotella jejuni]
MDTKRLLATSGSILMALSAFAANNQGAQNMASRLLGGTIALSTMLIIGFFSIIGYVIVAMMARKRNRSIALWILFSLLGTPWLMILILFCIGKDNTGLQDR